MNTTPGSITQHTDTVQTEDVLLTYSEAERQENEINRENAALVFQPAFIPFFPALQREHNLTDTEAKIYGFIWFYLSNEAKRFYFTNEQIGIIANCNPDSVSRSMKSLEEKGLITTSRRMRAGGGLIRFVEHVGTLTDGLSVRKLRNTQGNNNKINNNKIERETQAQLNKTLDYLLHLPDEDLPSLSAGLAVTPSQVRSKAEDLHNYCLSKGKVYRDYRALLRNSLKRDFPARASGWELTEGYTIL